MALSPDPVPAYTDGQEQAFLDEKIVGLTVTDAIPGVLMIEFDHTWRLVIANNTTEWQKRRVV
jgi:hypothetical protein